MNNCEQERYSVCIVNIEGRCEKPIYKYYRVADYYPEENLDELVPAPVRRDFTTPEGASENPDHLYNPNAKFNHDKRNSDFFLFQWRRNPNDSGKYLTRSFYDDPSILELPEPREVFILDCDGGEQGLRDALAEGIPFEGLTTSIFYIAYGSERDRRPALRCERDDFEFADGLIKLRHAIANVKETTPLSAPRVWLDDRDIIESPHSLTSYRKVYARLDELESDGNVLLRPLEYYALDYVKWFIREESIPASKADRRAISQIIDAALLRPDALEAYLEAGAQENEVQRLKESIARIVMEKDDSERDLFRKALLENKVFYSECVERVMRSSDALLQKRKEELASAKKDTETARNVLTQLGSEIEALKQEKAELETDTKAAADELNRAMNEQDEVLREIESNVALKLGLRTVAAQPCQQSPSASLAVEYGRQVEANAIDGSFEDALLNNLKRMGITSIVGKPDEERKRFVRGLVCGIAATKFIALPQAVARQVANSISTAIAGRTARRVCVPADFRDVAAVTASVATDDEVVLIEGVIDAVNEGVLFSLLAESPKSIVVLSFTSHASAMLVAKEAWNKMFLPNVESLVAYRAEARPDKLQCASKAPNTPNVCFDDVASETRDLIDALDSLCLPAGPLLIASIVLCAVEEIADDECTEWYVSQYLLMSSRCDTEAFAEVEKWSEGDSGLLELARNLGIYGS